ncbi:MAG: hypothetical protein RMJ43_14565 [Chloroherpetonaceae bacterium]|nr:hypothetical protein [Chthonomonadaceae bacterium]MDW8209055.1 hypothetical protein [Chloroherpetonaceae bacterium]
MKQAYIDDVRLIAPRDPGYQAFLRRLRSERQQRHVQHVSPAGNSHQPVSASATVATVEHSDHAQNGVQTDGEITVNRSETRPSVPAENVASPQRIGKQVERVARFWLAQYMKLDQNTILTWRERTSETWSRHYAELDAVHRVDYDTVLVAEVKYTSEAAMRSGKGRQQLERAARLLQTTRSGRRVLQRLVYIGNGDLQLPGIIPVPPEDQETPFGVIWISASTLDALAARHDMPLPANWYEAPRSAVPSETEAIDFRTPAFYMCA